MKMNTLPFISLFLTTLLSADINLSEFSGSWHMRVMDGMEVRKARAILDFNAQEMRISGFDACNRILGTLKEDPETKRLSAQLVTTRMACRTAVHTWVSKRLHETINESFNITKEEKYGVEGIVLKSENHELFFKRMGKQIVN